MSTENDIQTTDAPPRCAPSGGSGGKPAIVAHFRVMLTEKQIRQISRAWNKSGKTGGAMIAQPVTDFGPFRLNKQFLSIGICNKELAGEIGKAIDAAEKLPSPPNARADLPPTEERQPRSGTEGAIGG